MKGKIATVILMIGLAPLTRADSTVQEAQQELKEQGYYFGQINGEKDADTIAAIRRFQIRSGLPITGELDEQTLRTLRSGTASSSVPANTPQPQRREDNETVNDNQKKPRLRRVKGKLLDRNGHHRQPARIFLAIRPTKWHRRNYNSGLSSARKRCSGVAVFTKV